MKYLLWVEKASPFLFRIQNTSVFPLCFATGRIKNMVYIHRSSRRMKRRSDNGEKNWKMVESSLLLSPSAHKTITIYIHIGPNENIDFTFTTDWRALRFVRLLPHHFIYIKSSCYIWEVEVMDWVLCFLFQFFLSKKFSLEYWYCSWVPITRRELSAGEDADADDRSCNWRCWPSSPASSSSFPTFQYVHPNTLLGT